MGKLKDLTLPLILISEIILCLSFGHLIPEDVKSALFALSLSIKEALLMVLPFIIFAFLAHSMGSLQRGAFSFIVIAFTMVFISNFTSTALGGFLGIFTFNSLDILEPFHKSGTELSPLWNFSFPHFISNDIALFAGLFTGLTLSMTNFTKGQILAQKAQSYALRFLKLFFIPLIPLFVLGFILKMDFDGVLNLVVQNYLSLFLAITVLSFGYIVLLYGLAAGFKPDRWFKSIRNMIPALVTGFSTMSSASALPLITTASERTTKNPLVSGVIPLSINIHMIGDCISLALLSMAILVSFGMALPAFPDFLMFTLFFVIARFSAAAVPGGGVIVILPVLEKYLNFSPEMLSLILALNILFDAVATSANVFGNGAFALLFEKTYSRVHQKSLQPA